MAARIYREAKNAMQSGRARRRWVLDFEPEAPWGRDPLLGWTTMTDMNQQVKLHFATREQAEAFAREHGMTWCLLPDHEPKPKHKSYADNFRFGRKTNWTH